MTIYLSLSQVTNLCVKDFIEVDVGEKTFDIKEPVYLIYQDIEFDGLIKKIKFDKNRSVVRIEKVDVGLKEEWFSCVRSLNTVDKHEANLLIHMLLDKLCRTKKWHEIDQFINLIDPKKDDLDIILSFLVATSPTESCRALQRRRWLYDSSYERLLPVITTYGVLENLRGEP